MLRMLGQNFHSVGTEQRSKTEYKYSITSFGY